MGKHKWGSKTRSGSRDEPLDREISVDFTETSSSLGVAIPPGYWKMKNGRFIAITDMTNDHLHRAINAITYGSVPGHTNREKLGELNFEFSRRNRGNRTATGSELMREAGERAIAQIRAEELQQRAHDAAMRQARRDLDEMEQLVARGYLPSPVVARIVTEYQELILRRNGEVERGLIGGPASREVQNYRATVEAMVAQSMRERHYSIYQGVRNSRSPRVAGRLPPLSSQPPVPKEPEKPLKKRIIRRDEK